MNILHDKVALDGIRRTADGYLTATARVARTGIQLYTGREVDPDNKHGMRDRAIVRVYRPDTEVFHKDSLASYAHKPVTNDHPREWVTADTWKDVAIGQVGDEVVRDGEFVRVPLVLMDAAAIADVENGKRELSMGYATNLKFEDGATPDGQKYDVVQTALRMNHLAVVAVARGGSHLKIGDSQRKDESSMTRTIMVDGLPVTLEDRDAAFVERAIASLTKRVNDAETALADASTASAKAIAGKDAEIAKKDAQIADLSGKVLDAAAIDKRVAERADLVAKAVKLVPAVKTDGVADAEIKKAVVVAVRGAEMADKSAAYIDAAFDLLGDVKSADAGLNAALGNRQVATDAASLADASWSKSVADLNGWRNQKGA